MCPLEGDKVLDWRIWLGHLQCLVEDNKNQIVQWHSPDSQWVYDIIRLVSVLKSIQHQPVGS